MAIVGGDWRDEGSYTPLLNGDRRCFAWEWLRRTPSYVETWSHGASAAPFGLLRRENPAYDALAARPLWSATIDHAVLQAKEFAADKGDHLDFAQMAPFATIVPRLDGTRHILLSDAHAGRDGEIDCGGRRESARGRVRDDEAGA